VRVAHGLARLLIAGLFLYAGVIKLGTSERFAITVAQFTLLPYEWINLFARTLPWVELATGILLLIPRTARLGAIAASALLLLFIGALAWAHSQGLVTDCGCFGEDAPATGSQIPMALARDLGLLAITLWLALKRSPAR
jgi:putative oxidoreductase